MSRALSMAATLWSTAVLLALSTAPLHADESAELIGCLAATRSLSANFSQSSQDSGDSLPLQLEGRLYLRAPHDARWDILRPYRESLLYNGNELWHHERDLEQLSIRALSPAAVPLLLLLNPEHSDWQRRFAVRREQHGDAISYHVTPRSDTVEQRIAAEPFSVLHAEFKDCRPHAIWWRDGLGRETRIALSRLRVNPRLSDKRFRLRVPPGTDVLRAEP